MSHRRQLSRPLVSSGFLLGWAHDPELAEVAVVLEFDGGVIEGSTGYRLHPEEAAEVGYPPRPDCGFRIPLPASLMDGFTHELTLRVPSWKLPKDPQPVRFSFAHGDLFGMVTQDSTHYSGWVAFRRHRAVLPPILIHDGGSGGAPVARVALTTDHELPPDREMVQLGRFRLPLESLAVSELRFFCGGIQLRLESTGEQEPKITGRIERIDRTMISGWAVDLSDPGRSLDLDLILDGRRLHTFRPNQMREDVTSYAGIPESIAGIHGFRISPPASLFDGAAHSLSVVCARSGVELSGAPEQVRFESLRVQLAGHKCSSSRPRKESIAAPTDGEVPVVSVVVLNRNGAELLESLCESWWHHNRKLRTELIIIDHDSSDGSLDVIERWRERLAIKIVVLDRNDSFSASCNRGAALACGEYLLFLNNDIVWVQDALPSMLATLRSERVAAVGIKLIKDERDHLTEVQHLGVRFKLVGDQYWPYEAVMDVECGENEYDAQNVPAVTGAVLLCRKSEFDQVAGFDQRYFYGYEDVEFCLRLSERLHKGIVCRNDLVALHRHGYTRLSGRERGVIDYHRHNSILFSDQLGLWIKQRLREELYSGRLMLTNERLTIAFAVADNLAFEEDGVTLTEVRRYACGLVDALPDVQVVALTPDRDWYALHDIHLLVVCHPGYDLRRIVNPRGDLVRVALVDGEKAEIFSWWQGQRWWPLFDAVLVSGAGAADRFTRARGLPFIQWEEQNPLGALTNAALRLRVAILVPCNAKQAAARVEAWRVGEGLRHILKCGGASAWLVYREQWGEAARVADVQLQIHTRERYTESSFEAQRGDLVRVLWVVSGGEHLARHALESFDQLWAASEIGAEILGNHETAVQICPPEPADLLAESIEALEGSAARQGTIQLHIPASGEQLSLIAGCPKRVVELRNGMLSPCPGACAADRYPERLFSSAEVVQFHLPAAQCSESLASPWMWLAHRLGAQVRWAVRRATATGMADCGENVIGEPWSPPPVPDPVQLVDQLQRLVDARMTPFAETADESGAPRSLSDFG